MKEFKNKNYLNDVFNNSNLINRLSNLIYIFLFANLLFISGCSAFKKSEDLKICSYSNLPCLASTEYVLLITNKGKIKLELYGKSAPITVANFVNHVENGAYDKTFFDRVIREPYPFIIRGGDNSLIKGENKFIDNETGKVINIPLEIKLKTNNFPTYGKEIDISNHKNNIELRHKRSYLSMARSKKLNSASYRFYISLKSIPELDGRFAVFGKVISGMNVVDLIEEKDFIVEAKRL